MTTQLFHLKVTRAMLDLLRSSSGDKTRTAYMQLESDGKIVFANITMHANVFFCVFSCANHCKNYFPIARNYLMAIYCVHEQFPQCTLHTHLKKMPLRSWSFFCFIGLRRSCCCRQQCAAGGRRRFACSRGSFFGHCCARRRHCCTSAHYAAG